MQPGVKFCWGLSIACILIPPLWWVAAIAFVTGIWIQCSGEAAKDKELEDAERARVYTSSNYKSKTSKEITDEIR